jgi:hypothetical protein
VLMNSCISSMCFLVLVNGSPIGFFSSSLGLSQGDPLSLLLFVIVMEALSMMISAVVSGGLLSSFSVGIVTDISHLLFVNDTFFFVVPTQIIYTIYGVYSYVLKLCQV